VSRRQTGTADATTPRERKGSDVYIGLGTLIIIIIILIILL
jgi:hypothetical protein